VLWSFSRQLLSVGAHFYQLRSAGPKVVQSIVKKIDAVISFFNGRWICSYLLTQLGAPRSLRKPLLANCSAKTIVEELADFLRTLVPLSRATSTASASALAGTSIDRLTAIRRTHRRLIGEFPESLILSTFSERLLPLSDFFRRSAQTGNGGRRNVHQLRPFFQGFWVV